MRCCIDRSYMRVSSGSAAAPTPAPSGTADALGPAPAELGVRSGGWRYESGAPTASATSIQKLRLVSNAGALNEEETSGSTSPTTMRYEVAQPKALMAMSTSISTPACAPAAACDTE